MNSDALYSCQALAPLVSHLRGSRRNGQSSLQPGEGANASRSDSSGEWVDGEGPADRGSPDRAELLRFPERQPRWGRQTRAPLGSGDGFGAAFGCASRRQDLATRRDLPWRIQQQADRYRDRPDRRTAVPRRTGHPRRRNHEHFYLADRLGLVHLVLGF